MELANNLRQVRDLRPCFPWGAVEIEECFDFQHFEGAFAALDSADLADVALDRRSGFLPETSRSSLSGASS
ncbi:hypothetical protein MOQ72_43000 [Saccharopolyspora sp. K220]|nr:hypothetical protein [Saccharopolyspora soli]MCI2424184.1 hypothetical protein [Saccharopolyspora soli]